ncbi:MAG: hypothetical protein ACK58T_49585 [Phycisphaerae bacterium]
MITLVRTASFCRSFSAGLECFDHGRRGLFETIGTVVFHVQ